MKKIIAAINVLALALCLTACTGSENSVPESNTSQTDSSAPESSASDTSTESTTSDTDPAPETEPQQTTTSETEPEPTEPAEENAELAALKEAASGSVLAVSYVGFVNDATEVADCVENSSVAGMYSFIGEIPSDRWISAGGYELYCIVPTNSESDIVVYTTEMDYEANLSVTGTIYEGKGEPFLLVCNFSDIMTNTIISVTDGGTEYKYSPYMSLEDGSLGTADNSVFDFSIYG